MAELVDVRQGAAGVRSPHCRHDQPHLGAREAMLIK